MTQVLYYVDDYTDEVIPCAPTLEAWAEWLSKPDPEWQFAPHAAEDGDTFTVSTVEVLGDIQADLVEGVWTPSEPAPDGTQFYYLRHDEGASGWNAEFCGDDLETAADGLEADDSPAFFACTRDGPNYVATYRADPPRLVLEPAQ